MLLVVQVGGAAGAGGGGPHPHLRPQRPDATQQLVIACVLRLVREAVSGGAIGRGDMRRDLLRAAPQGAGGDGHPGGGAVLGVAARGAIV